MKRIGFFGITGNPPHFGHLRAAEIALNNCEEVLVSPVYKHPFNKIFIDYEYRLEMIKMMFFGLKSVSVVEIDRDFYLANKRMPYSYDLLNFIKSKDSNLSPMLIIGEDNYQPEIWKKFFNYDKIDNEFGVIAIKDSGCHSTQIRDFVKNGNWERVEKECGKKISSYLRENYIYSLGEKNES
jgi:nicotinate-nucleotide adenylyltransferase